MAMTFEFYEVGGCVRDDLLGKKTKDIDFTAVWTGAEMRDPARQGEVMSWTFERLEEYLRTQGYEVFLSTPEYLTIRAKFPKGHLHERTTADFVLARKDGPYLDGRRPEWVKPGTLEDDLARRDFTVNAIARTVDGELIDPHNGQADLATKTLRFVGRAADRLAEDALRAFRGFRFEITKGMKLHLSAVEAIGSLTREDFSGVSTDRIRDELEKCFKADTWRTLTALMDGPEFAVLTAVAFEERKLRLIPSMKQ